MSKPLPEISYADFNNNVSTYRVKIVSLEIALQDKSNSPPGTNHYVHTNTKLCSAAVREFKAGY